MKSYKIETKVRIRRGTRNRRLAIDNVGIVAKIDRTWVHKFSFTYDVSMPDGRLIGFHHDELELVKNIKLKKCMQWQ